jgi:hypothetical protein
MGLLFRVSSSSTACTFTLFFAVRLSRLVLTSCNLEQYEVDTILCDIVKTLHVIVGFFVKRNFVLRIKIFLMTFPIGCSVSFCLKTLP